MTRQKAGGAAAARRRSTSRSTRWYVARRDLLKTILEEHLGPATRVLDVGSDDGPSVDWMRSHGGLHVTTGHRPARAGGATACADRHWPCRSRTVSSTWLAPLDVLEHCEPEAVALREITRVLAPGGRLLMSVPAYDLGVVGLRRRQRTPPPLHPVARGAGTSSARDCGSTGSTYAFSAVFPFFAAQRIVQARERIGQPRDDGSRGRRAACHRLPVWMSRMFLALARADQRVLRRRDLPFGSSVVVVATKAARREPHRHSDLHARGRS